MTYDGNPLISDYRLYEVCGKDGYPPEWHKVLKHRVREEAGYRCARCSHPYPPDIAREHARGEWTPCDSRCTHDGPYRYLDKGGEWKDGTLLAPQVLGLHRINGTPVQARYRILTVHHLDMNKLNCRWWNLAALCQRCHLQIQGKVKMHQTYPFEHSEWFKPFAAGYYAWTYLGEELTREETMARLDELLALELASL